MTTQTGENIGATRAQAFKPYADSLIWPSKRKLGPKEAVRQGNLSPLSRDKRDEQIKRVVDAISGLDGPDLEDTTHELWRYQIER